MNTEPKPLRSPDGTLHFSDLKFIGESPAHYRARILRPKSPTRSMRVGTITHFLTLGPRKGTKPLICEPEWGDLRAVEGRTTKEEGKANKDRRDAWRLEHDGTSEEIVDAGEWATAEPIAEALKTHPVARRFLTGAQLEVPLEWEMHGFKCSTTGVDILNAGDLVDLKTTPTVAPNRWEWHAQRMKYHVQMAWYRLGALANGIDVSTGVYILGVEYNDPWDVRALELTEGSIEKGEREIVTWLERLRVCEASNTWPGYALAPTPWDVTEFGEGEEGEELSDEENAA